MPRPDVFLKQGDTAPALVDTLRDQDDVPVSITDATVRLLVAPIDGPRSQAVAYEAENLEDTEDAETTGLVRYQWQEGDTDVPGVKLAEWEVTFLTGGVLTFPNGGYLLLLVSPQLEAPVP